MYDPFRECSWPIPGHDKWLVVWPSHAWPRDARRLHRRWHFATCQCHAAGCGLPAAHSLSRFVMRMHDPDVLGTLTDQARRRNHNRTSMYQTPWVLARPRVLQGLGTGAYLPLDLRSIHMTSIGTDGLCRVLLGLTGCGPRRLLSLGHQRAILPMNCLIGHDGVNPMDTFCSHE